MVCCHLLALLYLQTGPGDGGVICDYDRACDDSTDAVTVGDLVSTWTIPVGSGRALVLDGEISTTAVLWEGGLVILRDAPIEMEDQANKIIAATEPSSWLASPHELHCRGGRLFIFDSAAEGASTSEQIDAEGGVLDLELTSGHYRVKYATPDHPTGTRLTLIRLSMI